MAESWPSHATSSTNIQKERVMQQPQMHQIPSFLLNDIANYLAERPFREVEPLLNGIRRTCAPLPTTAPSPELQEASPTVPDNAPPEPVAAAAPALRKPTTRSKPRAK
ncbi:hypothetical protein ORIO_02230 [Cereibacter azotoformans]|nr:hypothetical protein [Cereibacter azotoformans]ULB08754.1 hypothetical protein ORIO_02230 [Cereibacter azotoformans]